MPAHTHLGTNSKFFRLGFRIKKALILQFFATISVYGLMHYYVQLKILGGRLEAAFGLPPGPANNIFAIENYSYILMGRGWSLI